YSSTERGMQRGFLIFLPSRLPSFLICQQKLRNISFVAQFAGERRQGAVPSGHKIHKDSRDEGKSPPHRVTKPETTAAKNAAAACGLLPPAEIPDQNFLDIMVAPRITVFHPDQLKPVFAADGLFLAVTGLH